MTYEESAALMSDFAFRNRIKVACVKYADSLMNEPQTTPAHNTHLKWASETFQNADAKAASIQTPVVMDAQVQSDGAAITDEKLQGSVEAVVNKSF